MPLELPWNLTSARLIIPTPLKAARFFRQAGVGAELAAPDVPNEVVSTDHALGTSLNVSNSD
jgi:hypothetical protein